jgi:hypothetical protein
MKSGARDEAEGKWHKVKGKLKEFAGELSNDPKFRKRSVRSRRLSGSSESGVSRMHRRVLDHPAAAA